MTSRELNRRLRSLWIREVEQSKIPADRLSGRPAAMSLDRITLSDGTVLTFSVIETEGDYGIAMQIHEPPREGS